MLDLMAVENQLLQRWQRQLVNVCDILHVYDNTDSPFRIFKKRKDVCFRWENDYWNNENIAKLTGIHDYK